MISIGMMAFGFLRSKLGSTLTRILFEVLAALALVAAVWIWFHVHDAHIAARARAEVLAKEKAATEAESARRLDVIQQTRAEADKDEAQISAQQSRIEELRHEVARLSAANDHRPCLDAGSVRRLNQVGPAPGR